MVVSEPFSRHDSQWLREARAYFVRSWRPLRLVVLASAVAVSLLLLWAWASRPDETVIKLIRLWLPFPLFAALWWFLPYFAFKQATHRSSFSRLFDFPCSIHLLGSDPHFESKAEQFTAPLATFSRAHFHDGALALWVGLRDFVFIPAGSLKRSGLDTLSEALSGAEISIRHL